MYSTQVSYFTCRYDKYGKTSGQMSNRIKLIVGKTQAFGLRQFLVVGDNFSGGNLHTPGIGLNNYEGYLLLIALWTTPFWLLTEPQNINKTPNFSCYENNNVGCLMVYVSMGVVVPAFFFD